jgi:hypothetical protein
MYFKYDREALREKIRTLQMELCEMHEPEKLTDVVED